MKYLCGLFIRLLYIGKGYNNPILTGQIIAHCGISPLT